MSDPTHRALPDRALDRVEVERKRPFELMVLALAEAGRPLSYGEIAERLARRGRAVSVVTLQKAWHGMPPIEKAVDGRLVLAPESSKALWDIFVWKIERELGIVPAAVRAAQPQTALDVEAPVSRQELETAFAEPVPSQLSSGQRIGLVLEAARKPLSETEIEAEMKSLGIRLWPGSLASCGRNPMSPIRSTAGESWTVDSSFPAMREARAFVRKRVARKREIEAWRLRSAQYTAERDLRERADAERRAGARKGLVRTFWFEGRLVAGAVLDPDAHSVQTVHDLGDLRSIVAGCEIVIALDPRIELERLGVDVGGRELVSLRPPVKSRRLNRAGRILRVSPELVYRSTIGRSNALYDARKLARYLRAGQLGRIDRRLESDAKSLHAVYCYGVLHGFLRLRWGFLREVIPVNWGPSGCGTLDGELKRASADGDLVDIVTFGPPGWSDPWSRAMRCRIRGRTRFDAVLERNGETIRIDLEDIYAIRRVEAELEGQGGPDGRSGTAAQSPWAL